MPRRREPTNGCLPFDGALASLDPMLASPVDAPFSAAGWLFEVKYDGFRLLARKERDGAPGLRFRSGRDATRAYPEVAAAIGALPAGPFVLDGELVIVGGDGRPDFQQLQGRSRTRSHARATGAVMFVFDVLVWDGLDVRPLPLRERKALLGRAVPGSDVIGLVEPVEERGEDLFDEVVERGLEGVVAKRADSPYVAGRTMLWRKIRSLKRGGFVVVGFTRPELGSDGGLHLARADGDSLIYAGRVGSGFAAGVLAETRRLLTPMTLAAPACTGAVPRGRDHVWVEPRVACEVRYLQQTDDGLLRQPVFLRFVEVRR